MRVGTAVLGLVVGAAGGWLGSSMYAERVARARGPGSAIHWSYTQLKEYSGDARLAGSHMISTMVTGSPAGCAEARQIWTRLGATENFGGEYGALDWLCTWLEAPTDARAALMDQNPDGRRLVTYFDLVGWRYLKDYVAARYEIPEATVAGRVPTATSALEFRDLLFIHELLRFNGPQRAAWERTDEMLAALQIRPGMAVADVGAGNGFVSFRFADLVGPGGRVYALELEPRSIAFIDRVKAVEELANIQTVTTTPTDLTLPPDSVDLVWVCNLYHEFYGGLRDAERAELVASMRSALRAGGRLVVADNMPEGEMPAGSLRYQGFAISPRLLVEQIEAYGFELVARHDLVPQRYVLEFVER